MSEELKNKVLGSRINEASERLSKNEIPQSLKGEAYFKEMLRQLKPEFEEAHGELSKMYNHREWEIIKKLNSFEVLVFIAKIIFSILTIVELFYAGEYNSNLPIVLAIAFGTLAVIFWFAGSVINSYNEKVEIVKTGIEIDEMEQGGKK